MDPIDWTFAAKLSAYLVLLVIGQVSGLAEPDPGLSINLLLEPSQLLSDHYGCYGLDTTAQSLFRPLL